MEGLHNGTQSVTIATYETVYWQGKATHTKITHHNQFPHSAGAWDSYLIPDHAGRYFYDILQWALPTTTVYRFPHDSPQFFLTDLEE
jgi:hypothetical protein